MPNRSHQFLHRTSEEFLLTGIQPWSIIDIAADNQRCALQACVGQVCIDEMGTDACRLGHSFFTIGIGDRPPFAPLVGTLDRLAFQVQSHYSEPAITKVGEFDIEGTPFEGVYLRNTVIFYIQGELVKRLHVRQS